MSWFYLALLAPLLYAIVNLLDDNLLSFVYKSPCLATVSAGFFGALPLLILFFINANALSPLLASFSIGAGFFTVVFLFFYFKGLESDSPSVVVALLGLAPATIPFFAHFLLNERLNSLEILGFIIVLIASLGLAVIDLKKLKFSKAAVPVVIAVLFGDAVAIMTKYAFQRADFYPVYLYISAGMGLGGLFFLLAKFTDNKRGISDIVKNIKKLLPIFVLTELVALSAEFVRNLAVSRGPVSLVEVIQGIQPMFVLLIALTLYPVSPKFFREAEEGHPIRKFVLMAILVVGLVIIGFAAKD